MPNEIVKLFIFTVGAICSIWVMLGFILAILFQDELKTFFKKRAKVKAKAKAKKEAEAKEAPPNKK